MDRSRLSTAGRRGCWCPTCTSGRARSGSGACAWPMRMNPASGRRWGITTWVIHGRNSATPATDVADGRGRGDAAGDRAGEKPDGGDAGVAGAPARPARGRAADGRRRLSGGAELLYRLPPEDRPKVTITVERLDDGEVSPYLVDEVQVGDHLELRGPIGGYFVWKASLGGPLLLVGGGSGIVPLMAMLRHRRAVGSTVPARLLYSARSQEEVIYGGELGDLMRRNDGLLVTYTLTRQQPPGWTGYHRRIDEELL